MKTGEWFGVILFGFLATLLLSGLIAWQIICTGNINSLFARTTITYSKLGQHGRLGNQLFQVAATVGLGHHLRKSVKLPHWPYLNKLFRETGEPALMEIVSHNFLPQHRNVITEHNSFLFEPVSRDFAPNHHVDLIGFRINPRYFSNIVPQIRRAFRFQSSLIKQVREKMTGLLSPPTIALQELREPLPLEEDIISEEDTISNASSPKEAKEEKTEKAEKAEASDRWIGLHVRRGDYVNNRLYDFCTLEYYANAVRAMRVEFPDAPVLIVSDDKLWCRQTLLSSPEFQGIGNLFISPFDTEHEDFVAFYLCDGHICSNSTFAWWATWLDARYTSRTILPKPWIRGDFEPDDYVDLYRSYDLRWQSWDTEKTGGEKNENTLKEKGDQKQESVTKAEIKEPLWFGWQVGSDAPQIIKIGAYYQCYKQPKAFFHACEQFRSVYPDSSLVIVSDAGDDFSNIAMNHFKATSYKRNAKRDGNGQTTFLHDYDKVVTFIRNFIEGAQQIKEEFFVLLEDDLAIVRPLFMPKKVMDYFDLIGNNNGDAKFNHKTAEFLRNYVSTPNYYGGCGGSLFRTEFWKQMSMKSVEGHLKQFGLFYDQMFHSDIVLSYLCLVQGGKLCCAQKLFPTEFGESPPVFGSVTYPAILHRFKELYDKPLTAEEEQLISGKSSTVHVGVNLTDNLTVL